MGEYVYASQIECCHPSHVHDVCWVIGDQHFEHTVSQDDIDSGAVVAEHYAHECRHRFDNCAACGEKHIEPGSTEHALLDCPLRCHDLSMYSAV